MFQGSEHHDSEYFEPLEKLGANINGSTNTDRTNYFEVVPSNALERALWLEADRMGFLLPALTQEKLDNQRDVVKNERRQRVDNVPYGQAMERMLEALYPPGHPYHHSVIGSLADLSAASLEDVKNFFRTYYNPNNASLVIAGDIDKDEAKQLVEKYFGAIPAGPKVEPLEPRVPTLEEPKHVTMTDQVALARTQLVLADRPGRRRRRAGARRAGRRARRARQGEPAVPGAGVRPPARRPDLRLAPDAAAFRHLRGRDHRPARPGPRRAGHDRRRPRSSVSRPTGRPPRRSPRPRPPARAA